jgi:uncharacterized protein (DUF1015 family)
MAEIVPFLGVRYNPEVISDLNQVVAPPYDVIDEDEVRAYQAKSLFNITHLTRPLGDDPYVNAANFWNEWLDKSIVRADAEPSFYIYQQTFADPDTGAVVPERQALICALKLEEYSSGKVLPHENTLTAARADRLNLMRTTHANLECIYGLYSDPDREVESFVQQCADRETVIEKVEQIIGSSHRVERIGDPTATAAIAEMLRDKPIFIADGHHRYETALAYKKEFPEMAGGGYILIALTAFEDEGILVLPTHRLLKGLPEEKIANLPAALAGSGFQIAQSADASSSIRRAGAFTLLLPAGQSYEVRLPEGADVTSLVEGSQSRAWKSLDVTLLHALILEKLLGISMADLATTDKVAYTRDAAEARKKVDQGEAQAAFLLARPSVHEIEAVSVAHDKMPQKSTFFYPKLLSGLVMRDLRGSIGQ